MDQHGSSASTHTGRESNITSRGAVSDRIPANHTSEAISNGSRPRRRCGNLKYATADA